MNQPPGNAFAGQETRGLAPSPRGREGCDAGPSGSVWRVLSAVVAVVLGVLACVKPVYMIDVKNELDTTIRDVHVVVGERHLRLGRIGSQSGKSYILELDGLPAQVRLEWSEEDGRLVRDVDLDEQQQRARDLRLTVQTDRTVRVSVLDMR